MDTSQIAILVHTMVSIGTSLVSHWAYKDYWVASCLAAVSAGVIFQLIAYLQTGYLDQFFIVAFFISMVISFIIALLVDLPFLWLRSSATK